MSEDISYKYMPVSVFDVEKLGKTTIRKNHRNQYLITLQVRSSMHSYYHTCLERYSKTRQI